MSQQSGNQTRTHGERTDDLQLRSGLEALQSSPEFDGAVESLEGHESNDHFTLIYENQAEQFASVVPFVRQGLERNEHCMYIVDDNSKADVLAALRDGGVDVDAALASGALTLHTKQDSYLRNGSFDPDEMIDFLGGLIDEALEEYEGFRIAGEMTWIFDNEPDVDALLEYEGKLNRLLPETDSLALCQYNRNQFSPEILRDVIRTHPHLIYQNTVCQNVYYTPPEEFFGPEQPEREIDRMMEMLVDRSETKATLQEQEERLRRQNEITGDPDQTFEEKLQELFELGCERFGLELGAMARVDPDADTFEIEYTSDDHEHFEPGVELPLSETYCTSVLEREDAASVSNPEDGTYDDITVYREFGIETYIGTYIEVDGASDRTFFFVSSEERDEAFSDEAHTFQQLMGQWVKYELERQHHEQHQRTLYEVAADTNQTFDEKLQGLFELGCERFDLELGGMARIDPTTDHFEVEAVSDEHEHLNPGTRVALSETYCRVFADDGGTASVSDPVGSGFESATSYEEFGVNAYLGTRLEVAGGLDRTFFFISSEEHEAFSDEAHTFQQLMGQWVKYELERKQRENRLAALNELSRELMDIKDASDMSEYVVDAADETLKLPVTAIALFDEQEGTLQPAAATDAAEDLLSATSLLADGEGWQALVTNETRRTTDPLNDANVSLDPQVTELAVLPLSTYGVLVTGTTACGGFDPTTFDFTETVAANAEAALNRADREQRLHDREQTLEAQNEKLERLNRVNTIIRDIHQALVSASTREEIEQVVCEQLADVGPYKFAWVGEHDTHTNEIVPQQRAGAGQRYLEEVTVTADDSPSGQGPAGRAVKTREPQTTNNILDDHSFDSWRQAAINRGYHASIALPLVYEDTLYGVLNVYAGHPGVFDDLEQSVLMELSNNIAHSINAVESKKALMSDEVTELEFTVDEPEFESAPLVHETDCEVTLENIVPRSNGSLRSFFSVRGSSPDEVCEFVPQLPVKDANLVSKSDDISGADLYEIDLTDDSLPEVVLEHGGTVHQLHITADTATVTVHLATDAATREFVEMFQRKYPGAELVAQRVRDRPNQTFTDIQTELSEELTARQLETFQTAYFSGYFERPRIRTGSEIADTMDISQPTFNTHLRDAQRKICERLLEGKSFKMDR